MQAFVIEERIARPPEVVFDFLSDLEAVVAHTPSLLELAPLTAGPLRKGSRLRQIRHYAGKPRQAEVIVGAYQRPSLFSLLTEYKGVQAAYHYLLAPKGENGTRLVLECQVATQNAFVRVMLPAAAALIQSEDGDQLKRYKAAIEQL